MDLSIHKNEIAGFMSTVMKDYQLLRGKKRTDSSTPFWDLIVITAADEDQKSAFDAQLQGKFSRKELPLDCPIHVVADQPGPKLGNGGSTLTSLEFLENEYKDELYTKRVIVIHAGGQSRRMPSTSILGKIFAAVPCGNPMYQMLDVKLAMYLPFLPKMPPGVFICCADDFLVYSIAKKTGSDEEKQSSWEFSNTGFTALAHPSTLAVGVKHGVYVVDSIDKIDTTKTIQQSDCLQVLQKPSEEEMHKRSAVLNGKNLQFPDGVKIKGSVAYTDSAYFFSMDIAKKFLQFLKTDGPITCEIDAYGDFLQALGPNSSIDYTRHTPNVTTPTPQLIPTREKIFNLLKDSTIQLLLMNASQFVHIGTTKEYIHYFCFDSKFQEEMSLGKDVFNSWTEAEDEDEEPVAKKRAKLSDVSTGCVMHSILPKKSFVPENSVVEYCHFHVPVHIGQNSIVNNCSYQKSVGDQVSVVNPTVPLKIPHNVFLHTVPIKQGATTRYVTIIYHIDDNLKRSISSDKVHELPLLGATIEDYCSCCSIDTASILADHHGDESEPVSLWTLSLHPIADTMTESLDLALKVHQTVTKRKTSKELLKGRNLISMDTILQRKDVKDMLDYRNDLQQQISLSSA